MSGLSGPRLIPGLLAAALALGLVLAPVGLSGDWALGTPTSEAPVHLWSLWVSTAGLWEHGPLVRVAEVGFPEGFSKHLMDPVNLAVFAPIYGMLGGGVEAAVRAWNGLFAVGTLLAAAGALRLARRLGRGDLATTWAAPVLVLGLAASAFVLGFPAHGRTELWPAVLAPLHLAALHRLLLASGEEGGTGAAHPVKPGLLAGVSLGAMALGGGYLATFLLVGLVPVALAWGALHARRQGLASAALRLALVGLPAVLLVLPGLWALLAHPPEALTKANGEIPSLMTGTSDVVFGLGAHLRLRAIILSRPLEAPAYPGAVLVILGLIGLVLRPRTVAPWLAWGVWLVLLAAGPFLVLGTDPVGRDLDKWRLPPFFIEAWFPALRPISSWSRLACLVSLPAAVAAFLGLEALLARLRHPALVVPLALGLSGLVAWDQATYPTDLRTLERRFEAAPPTGLVPSVAQLPEGALVVIPLDLQLGPETRIHGLRLLWQLEHGRPVTALPPEQDALLDHSYTARILALVQEALDKGRSPQSAWIPAAGPERDACVGRDLARLAREGHGGLVWIAEDDPTGLLRDLVEGPLGEPVVDGGQLAAWALHPDLGDGGEACRLPPLPGTLRPSLPGRG